MGLLLCVGTVFGMDDIVGMDGYAAIPFGAAGFATPPSSPGGRRISTPGAPVKTTYADQEAYVHSLYQIFLNGPTPELAQQVSVAAHYCLNLRVGTDNATAELKQMIVSVNTHLGRVTSPSLYAAPASPRVLFAGPNDDEIVGGYESRDSEYDSDEFM